MRSALVWVVEGSHEDHPGEWYVYSVHLNRRGADDDLEQAQRAWKHETFRIMVYRPSEPQEASK